MFYNNDKRKILFRCKNNDYRWCIDDNRNINIVNFRIMKELDKTKSYDLSKLNEEQIHQLAEYVYENKHSEQDLLSTHDAKEWIKQFMHGRILTFYNEPSCYKVWEFGKNEKTTNEIICATTLFNEDVWIPKQGEKVLVSADGINYTKDPFLFVSKCKDINIIERNDQGKYDFFILG